MAQPTVFHDYVTVVTDIDRRKFGERVVPMKVLCLGLPRTGTDSLRRALKLLGINDVYHGFPAFFENPRDCEMWLEAHDAKFGARGKPFGRTEFDMLLGHCQAVADHPCCVFAEELVQAYPDAKVILTTRPVEDWYRSMSKTLMVQRPLLTLVVTLGWLLKVHNRYALLVVKKDMQQLFGEDFASNAHRKYNEHNDWIRSMVPKERLLEMPLGEDGWDPLCKFLDVDKPKTDYPKGNATSSLNQKFDAVFWYTLRLVIKKLRRYVIIGAAGLYACWWTRNRIVRGNPLRNPTTPWYWRDS